MTNNVTPWPFVPEDKMPKEANADTKKLLDALALKYGQGTMLAGASMQNLRTVMDEWEKNTTLDAERKRALRAATDFTIGHVMNQLAPALGCCCWEHMIACADSIKEFSAHLISQTTGENLEEAQAECAKILARVSGGNSHAA
jgi:hypothetical protein